MLRGGHKMEFTCVAHSDDTIYLGSGDGTVSAWSLQPSNIEDISAEEKPLKQLFIVRGGQKSGSMAANSRFAMISLGSG